MNQELDRLEQARAQLESVRSAQPEGPPLQTGRGSALDGRIEVEMGEDGRLTGLALDPAVLRMDERMLAREIMSAVNQAWVRHQGAGEDAAAIAAIDPEQLRQSLTVLQDQGLATMRRFTEGIQSAIDRIDRR